MSSFYAQWRVRCGVVPLLRDNHDSPPERLLQGIWLHQRLLRDQLRTLDGCPVRVLHPGFHNVEGGPDFKGAIIQFGEDPPRAGDVEVDLRPGSWRAHGHDRNPAFEKVILHVLWEGAGAVPGGPAAVIIHDLLDAPVGELNLWLGGEAAFDLPVELRGRCCAPLASLDGGQLRELLQQAAQVRLQAKGRQLHARARQVGWEQSLWEGIFRALGYKHNVWPMQRLAELRSRWSSPRADPLAVQARLFGISGLLPAELTRSQPGADHYVRRIWDQWWRERDQFLDCLLPRGLWRLHGLRPANQPQRRLALGAQWSVDGDLPAKIEQWFRADLPRGSLASSLAEALRVGRDEFWSWHWTLRSPRLSRPQPLLGCTRVADLAVNVILPWLWVRAAEGSNLALQQRVEDRYFAWPSAEDNAVLRLGRQRLLGGASRRFPPGAAAQQGLIQMVRDFCDHSNAICDACKLPDLVREWKTRAGRSAVDE